MFNFNVLAGYSPAYLRKTKKILLNLARERYPRVTLDEVGGVQGLLTPPYPITTQFVWFYFGGNSCVRRRTTRWPSSSHAIPSSGCWVPIGTRWCSPCPTPSTTSWDAALCATIARRWVYGCNLLRILDIIAHKMSINIKHTPWMMREPINNNATNRLTYFKLNVLID